MFKEILIKSRSYRRFFQNERIPYIDLKYLIECARYVPSTVNSQPLKFIIVYDEIDCEKVYNTLTWAGLLKDWSGPEVGERPSAYIIILGDLSIGKNKFIDVGITAQTIMLAANDKGYGGCMFGSINKPKLISELKIDSEKYSVELVLALGKPKESVVIVDMDSSGSTAYYRDESSIHYVPKRSVEDLIVE